MTNDNLNRLLEQLVTTIDQTKNFTLEQAPLLAKEIVNYTIFETGIESLVCIIVIILLLTLIKLQLIPWYKSPKKDYMDDKILPTLSIMGCCLIIGLLFCGIMQNVQGLIKATMAPRLLILDYLKKTVK